MFGMPHHRAHAEAQQQLVYLIPAIGLGHPPQQAAAFLQEALDAQGGGAEQTHPASEAAIASMASGTYSAAAPSSDCRGDSCPVCQDDIVDGDEYIQMPCKHSYHKDCLLPWLKEHNTCPSCRAAVEEQPPPVSTPGEQPPQPQHHWQFPQQQQQQRTAQNLQHFTHMFASAAMADEEERQLQAAIRLSLETPEDGTADSDTRSNVAAGLPPDAVLRQMRVRQLKALLDGAGVDYSHCLERHELLALAVAAAQGRSVPRV